MSSGAGLGCDAAQGCSTTRSSFAAEVDGIDIRKPKDAGSVRTLWDAIDRYAVLMFHDQPSKKLIRIDSTSMLTSALVARSPDVLIFYPPNVLQKAAPYRVLSVVKKRADRPP